MSRTETTFRGKTGLRFTLQDSLWGPLWVWTILPELWSPLLKFHTFYNSQLTLKNWWIRMMKTQLRRHASTQRLRLKIKNLLQSSPWRNLPVNPVKRSSRLPEQRKLTLSFCSPDQSIFVWLKLFLSCSSTVILRLRMTKITFYKKTGLKVTKQ